MAGRSARRFKLLGAAVLVVVVGWSILWFIAATVVDRQVDRFEKLAMDSGATATCLNRSVTGFPFRIELRCRGGSRAGNAEGIVTIGGLMVTAQVYDPSALIAEMAGPFEFASAGALPVKADWTLAHARADLDIGDKAVRQLTGEVKGLSLDVGLHVVSIGDVDASVRRDPAAAGDLDLYVSLADIVPMPGAQPSTLALQGRVEGGAPLLAGRPEEVVARIAASGLPLTVERMSFRSGEMELVADGALTLSPQGLIDGTLDVAIAGYDGGIPYLAVIDPAAGATLTQVLQNVLAYAPETAVGERKGKKLTFSIAGSRVRLGMITLPVALPRIVLAGG